MLAIMIVLLLIADIAVAASNKGETQASSHKVGSTPREYSSYDHPTLSSHHHRRRLISEEIRTVLVVRILDANAPIPETARTEQEHDRLYKILFGDDDDKPSVQQQMRSCSVGQLLLETVDNNNPILDVVVDMPSNDAQQQQQTKNHTAWVEAAAPGVLQKYYQNNNGPSSSYSSTVTTTSAADLLWQVRDLANHIIMVLPESFPDADFIAKAEVGQSISTFGSSWASSSLSAYMHELGHNLQLRHSNYGNDEYGDKTTYMSRSVFSTSVPLRCYNAAQHWQLGWYPSHRWSYNKTSEEEGAVAQLMTVAAFVDVAKTFHPVLVQIDHNVILQFNRAKLHNIHTGMMSDQITIVQDDGHRTNLLAGLQASEEHDLVKGNNNEQQDDTATTTIRVCDITIHVNEPWKVDTATISVGPKGAPSACPATATTSSQQSSLENPQSSRTGVPPPTLAPVAPPSSTTHIDLGVIQLPVEPPQQPPSPTPVEDRNDPYNGNDQNEQEKEEDEEEDNDDISLEKDPAGNNNDNSIVATSYPTQPPTTTSEDDKEEENDNKDNNRETDPVYKNNDNGIVATSAPTQPPTTTSEDDRDDDNLAVRDSGGRWSRTRPILLYVGILLFLLSIGCWVVHCCRRKKRHTNRMVSVRPTLSATGRGHETVLSPSRDDDDFCCDDDDDDVVILPNDSSIFEVFDDRIPTWSYQQESAEGGDSSVTCTTESECPQQSHPADFFTAWQDQRQKKVKDNTPCLKVKDLGKDGRFGYV